MLLRKHIEKQCAYCAHAGKVDAYQVICTKRGIVPADGACRRFRYDPLKRVPESRRAINLERFQDADYSL